MRPCRVPRGSCGGLRWLLLWVSASVLCDSALAKYALVIDAGSSGSRLRVFKVEKGKVDEVKAPTKELAKKLETQPGISSYMSSVDKAGPSLQGLIDTAAAMVPKEEQSHTRLWLMATGGARLMVPAAVRALMDTIAAYLDDPAHSPFDFQEAKIVSGTMEATFAFLSINDLYGTLNGDTIGVLDMGGASVQIAFDPPVFIWNHEVDLYVNGARKTLFAFSYNGIGVNSGLDAVFEGLVKANPVSLTLEAPCLHTGDTRWRMFADKNITFYGTGDADKCFAAVKEIIRHHFDCDLPSCKPLTGPVRPASGKYAAVNAMFYTALNLRLLGWTEAKVITPGQLYAATKESCGMNKAQIVGQPHSDWKFQRDSCFFGNWAYRILRDYGFSDDDANITFLHELEGKHSDWTRGAMLYETVVMPSRYESHYAEKFGEVGQLVDAKDHGVTVWKVSCFLLLVVIFCLTLTVFFLARAVYKPVDTCSDISSQSLNSSDRSELEDGDAPLY